MKVEIIIPNYNGVELIKKNLPKVIEAAKSYKHILITIVDDCSEQNEQKELNKFIDEFKKTSPVPITLLKHTKNLGFSSTANTGALNSDADILIFLNSDVTPAKGFVEKTLKHFEKNNRLFGVGFMDRSIEEEKEVLRGRGIGKWQRGMLIHSRGEVDKTNTLWISGGSSGINAKKFAEFGGFDTLYNPFYWEDIDLNYRAQKKGYEVMFDPSIVVEHRHSEGSIKKQYGTQKIKIIAYRNQFIFIWKNISDPSLIFSHFVWFPYHVLKALVRFDTLFFLGLIQAIWKMPLIIIHSLKQRKTYLERDSEILNKFQE